MNQAQADKIKEVIAGDANWRGRLFAGPGRACVVGGLMEAMDPSLRVEFAKDIGIFSRNGDKIMLRLNKHYVFSRYQMGELTAINDRERLVKERRIALTELVQTWVTE